MSVAALSKLVAVATLMVAAVGAPNVSGALRPGCRLPTGAHLAIRTTSAIVYRTKATTNKEGALEQKLIGCLVSQGRPRVLATDGFDGLYDRRTRLIRSAGRWVAFAGRAIDRLLSRADYVEIVDLQSGASARALAHDGDTAEPLGRLLVSASGRLAWTLQETRTPTTLPTGLWTIERGKARVLDESADTRPSSVRLDGGLLRWTRAAGHFEARLAPALP